MYPYKDVGLLERLVSHLLVDTCPEWLPLYDLLLDRTR